MQAGDRERAAAGRKTFTDLPTDSTAEPVAACVSQLSVPRSGCVSRKYALRALRGTLYIDSSINYRPLAAPKRPPSTSQALQTQSSSSSWPTS